MSGKHDLESGQAASAEDAQASAAQPEQTGDKQSSSGETFTRAEYVKIAKEEAEKVWQSGKDRRIADLQEGQTTLIGKIEQLTGQKFDPNVIAQAENALLDDKIREDYRNRQGISQPAAPATGKQASGNDVTAVLTKYNLDSNDPAVSALVQSNAPAADFAFLAGQQGAKPANIASVASAGTGSPAPGVTQDALRQQYTEQMANAHGNPMHKMNLRREFIAKGLDLEPAA